VSLVEVVFPQGKHEHILARGLFRQIGDCCGGERKGSSPSLSPPPASSPPLPSVAHCLRHQHTALRATNTLCLPSAQRENETHRIPQCLRRESKRNERSYRRGTEAEVAE